MTTNIQQGTLLDVLKKKMRQTKEDMEKYKDECEEFHKRLQVEVMRREEVSTVSSLVKYVDDGMVSCNPPVIIWLPAVLFYLCACLTDWVTLMASVVRLFTFWIDYLSSSALLNVSVSTLRFEAQF